MGVRTQIRVGILAGLILLGLGIILIGVFWILPIRISFSWPLAFEGCFIHDKSQETLVSCSDDGCSTTYRAVLHVSYVPQQDSGTIDTKCYDSRLGIFSSGQKLNFLNQFQVNSTYPCWFNGDDRSEVILQKIEPTGVWILLGVLIATFIVGIGVFLKFASKKKCPK